VAPRFFGKYEHSLDAKGRVILPARFRNDFVPRAFLSQHEDRCLALWTEEEFDKQLAEHEALQGQGQSEMNRARVWASGSTEVEIDKQGRMAIPSYLRRFARLETDSPVMFTGAINRVELWNPTIWARRVQSAEAQIARDPEDEVDTAS